MNEQSKWDVYNEFALRGDLDRVTKVLARFELFKLVIDVPGDVVECGVLKGTGVLLWAKLIEIFNPLSRRKVIGFDTFEGYPTDVQTKHDQKTAKQFSHAQIQDKVLVSRDAIYQIADEQGLAHRIELIQGDAGRTIPEYTKGNPGFRIALLNLDFVIYDPTLIALKAFFPRIVKKGVIVFDEYAVPQVGESDAVDQVLAGHPHELKSFAWAKSPTAYMLKE